MWPKQRRHRIFLVLAFLMLAVPVRGQVLDLSSKTEEVSASPGFAVGTIGNEEQLGGWFGRTGKFTTIGVDVRYLSDYGDTGDSTEVVSVFVSWNAVPKLTVPLAGLVPQFKLPLPESVDVQLNLIARLGLETEHKDVVATVGAELALVTMDATSIAVRYEYAFSEDLWGDLSADLGQHQAFLNLIHHFKP